jgi:hypothetical protein
LTPDAVLTQTAFRLSEIDLEALRLAAKKVSLSPSEWIRFAVSEKLERDNNGAV